MPAPPATSAARHVVVTGAGSGIGNAVARELVRRGHVVFGAAISDAEAQTLSRDLGERLTPFVVDVRDERSVQAAAAQVAGQLGDRPLHALLNIAGVISNGPLADLPADEFSGVLAVNLVGMHAMTRALLPQLRPGGRVINMSSASGSRTMPFTGAYSASKFGVEALSAAMRMEFAALGVDVVVVAPGLINTPMAGKIQADLAREPSLPEYREPLRRFLAAARESAEHGIPIERVVATIAGAVEAPRPRRRYDLHHSVLRDVVLMRLLPTGRREAIVRRRLALDPPGTT